MERKEITAWSGAKDTVERIEDEGKGMNFAP